MSKVSLFDVFNVESPNGNTRLIPLDAVCTMGVSAEVKPDPCFVFDYKALRKDLMNLNEGTPIWCWGPSGCGKTERFIQIGARLQRPVHVISFGEESSIRELMGTFSIDSSTVEVEESPEESKGLKGIVKALRVLAAKGMGIRTQFRYGQLASSIQSPDAIVILDEFNMAPPGVAAQCNRLLETNELLIPDTGERIQTAKGVSFVVTSNTAGGADTSGLYAGSQRQNGATRSRFAYQRADYLSKEMEQEIINRNYPNLDTSIQLADGKKASELMIQLGGMIRTLTQEGSVSLPFTVRQLKRWAKSTIQLNDLNDAFLNAYLHGLDELEAVPVMEAYRKVFGVNPE